MTTLKTPKRGVRVVERKMLIIVVTTVGEK